MWHHLAGSVLNDLLSGSWITRWLSTGLVLLSLFSLGYLGGSSVQTLHKAIQPEHSWTKTSGSASETSTESLRTRHERFENLRTTDTIWSHSFRPPNVETGNGK